MNKKLYVGNIPWEATEEELKDLFETAGQVENVNIVKDRESGRSKGFGFITMASEEYAENAINALDGKTLGNRTLGVKEAVDKKDRPPRREGARREYN
jgi:RNA recognition motif-containing protein